MSGYVVWCGGTLRLQCGCSVVPPDLHDAICALLWAAPRTPIKELAQISRELAAKFGQELLDEILCDKDGCVNAKVGQPSRQVVAAAHFATAVGRWNARFGCSSCSG
jgi:hypothetical protein